MSLSEGFPQSPLDQSLIITQTPAKQLVVDTHDENERISSPLVEQQSEQKEEFKDQIEATVILSKSIYQSARQSEHLLCQESVPESQDADIPPMVSDCNTHEQEVEQAAHENQQQPQIEINDQVSENKESETVSEVCAPIVEKPITFMQKRLMEYEEQAKKEFGCESLDFKPRLSRLEQEKLNAQKDPNMVRSRTQSKDTQRLHAEAWGDSNFSSLFTAKPLKMTKLEQEKAALQQTSSNAVFKERNSLPQVNAGFMQDVVMRKSKLELAIEQSKKRQYSEISQSIDADHQKYENPSKRLKLNDTPSTTNAGNNFLSDVVIKKSRLEREKEAAYKQQMEEKENQLRNINQKGIVMKFDVNEPRGSKSPSTSIPRKGSSNSKNKTSVTENRRVKGFNQQIVQEVDAKLEQTMMKDE